MLGIIAAGTNRGNIAFWVYTPHRRSLDMEKHWNLQRVKSICNGVPVRSLKVSDTDPSISIRISHFFFPSSIVLNVTVYRRI